MTPTNLNVIQYVTGSMCIIILIEIISVFIPLDTDSYTYEKHLFKI